MRYTQFLFKGGPGPHLGLAKVRQDSFLKTKGDNPVELLTLAGMGSEEMYARTDGCIARRAPLYSAWPILVDRSPIDGFGCGC